MQHVSLAHGAQRRPRQPLVYTLGMEAAVERGHTIFSFSAQLLEAHSLCAASDPSTLRQRAAHRDARRASSGFENAGSALGCDRFADCAGEARKIRRWANKTNNGK